MLVCGKTICIAMEEPLTSSLPPQTPTPEASQPIPGVLTPEALEKWKARAREEAIRMTLLQQQMARPEPMVQPIAQPEVPASQKFQVPTPQPQVVYLRRNLTVAELIVVFIIACGLVTGVQATWNFASNSLPRIEIKAR